MNRKPPSQVYLILLIGFNFFVPKDGISQNDYLNLFGPQFVDGICQYYEYNIETNAEISTYHWDIHPNTVTVWGGFGDAISIQFYSPGTYVLILTVQTINGLQLSDSLTIEVYYQQPELEIDGCFERNDATGCIKVCEFSSMLIYDYQQVLEAWISGAVDYQIVHEGINVNWGPAGDGLIFIYDQNCPLEYCVEILPIPTVAFNTTPLSTNDTLRVCKNEEIFFQNTSTNGVTYLWLFGDGKESSTYNAVHRYKTEGFYTVTLKSSSLYCDCNSEKQLIVEVLPAPAPELDCVNSICAGSKQKYTATTDGCNEYIWTVSANGTIINGGGPSDDFIEIIWHEGPDGIIELSVDDCATTYCVSSKTFRIPIITTNGPITGDQAVCPAEIATYEAPYFPGVIYDWNVGPDGVIQSDQNTNAITVRWNDVNTSINSFVSVSYDNCFLECSGSYVLPVIINPKIKTSGDQQVCNNAIAEIEATAGFVTPLPVNVTWHIEDDKGNIVFSSGITSSSLSHNFSYPAGEYYWVATNASGSFCNDTIRQKIVVTSNPDPPVNILGENKICPGVPYGFTVEDAGTYATIWNVTDGTSSFVYTGQSIQHSFGNTPPYMIEAYHADIQYPECRSASIFKMIENASDLTIQGPDEVCFNNIDDFTVEYISGAEYKWELLPADRGEIKRSDLNNVSIFWTTSGVTTLRLHVCGMTFDKNILINALPDFNVVGPLSACENEKVLLSTDQPAFEHTWFDQNETIISTATNHLFISGNFGVTVKDNNSCLSEKIFTVSALPVPIINLTTTSPKTFCSTIPPGVDVVANTDGNQYTYEWFRNDVSIGAGTAVLSITDFGEYHVVVTNQYGCSATSLKIIFDDCCLPDDCIGTLPGCINGCAYIPQDFEVEISGTDCRTHRYTPQWPDIIPDQTRWAISSRSEGILDIINEDTLQYTYSKPGYYDIVMVALVNGFVYSPSVCGHRQLLMDTIRAVADFMIAGQCTGQMIEFEDLTTFLPTETIAGWSWDFDDPISGVDNFSSLQNPTHVFSMAGDYNVNLSVTMMSGCITSKSIVLHIAEGAPLAPVYDPDYCENEALSFYLPGDLFNIEWNFGDVSSGIQNSTQSDTAYHTYDLPGNYTVTVSATDIATCKSEKTFNVDIHNNNLSGIIAIDPASSICYGDTAILTSPAGGVSWLWSTNAITEKISVAESNQYSVLLYDQYDCSYTPPPVFIEVSPAPEFIIKTREVYGPDDFGAWQDSLLICHGAEFEIQVFSQGMYNYYTWSDGTITGHLSFTAEAGNLPLPGHYELTVFATDLVTGCTSDDRVIVIDIVAQPATPIISLVSGPGCAFNENVLAITNPVAGVDYVWSDGQTGTTITTIHVGSYFVNAINSTGCSSKSNLIHIQYSAFVDQIPAGCYTACDPLSLCLPQLENISSYSILKDGILIMSGTSWPDDFLITQDGSYTFELTNWNGCVATSDPLDIALYPGVGSVTVLTYLDVDEDGVIGPGDALLPNMPVELISSDGIHSGNTLTDASGEFVFEDFPSSIYTASFNQHLLSSEYKILIDSGQAEIKTCDDSLVISLLVTLNCFVTGPTVQFEICPGETVMYGDSSWTEPGDYTVHESTSSGCDSVFQIAISNNDSISINSLVWVDVDRNGILSAADTLLNNTIIFIEDELTAQQFSFTSGTSTLFPDGTYKIQMDTLNLTGGMVALYWNDVVQDTICGSASFNFLVSPTCAPVFVIQQEFICDGDSILIQDSVVFDEGLYSFLLSETGEFCDTTLDVYIRFYPSPALEATTSWNCADLGTIAVQPSGIGPFNYTWSNSTSTDSLTTQLTDGNYSITITDAHGCATSTNATITSLTPLEFSIDPYYEITLGDTVAIHISGDTMSTNLYQWQPANEISCSTCASANAFPADDVVLTIEIVDSLQCHYFLETNIVVNDIVPGDTIIMDEIFVPNVFSPNGDNSNDRFTLFTLLPDAYIEELTLLDRWGELVFHVEEIFLSSFDGWDGTFKGKSMNPQVFVYMAKIRLSDGRELNLAGDVTLVR